MSIITDLVAEIRAIPAVSSTVGARVFPLVDQGDTLPSITYNSRGGSLEAFVKGSFGLRDTFMQLDVYSADYAELDGIRNAIVDHFNGFIGNLNGSADDGGSFITGATIENVRELVDTKSPIVFRVIIEINFLSE